MKLKVKKAYPPNYAKINKAFPENKKHKAVFCYGDTIYNPFKIKLTRDLEIHEAVHTDQQGDDPEGWWNKYIEDKHFRLAQEIEAYGVQYSYLKSIMPEKLSRVILERMTDALSGELYGNIAPKHKVESAIRHVSKRT